jgi:hypothetical protein
MFSNHRFVFNWSTQALAVIEFTVDYVSSQCFNVSPVVHRFVKNLLWQNLMKIKGVP